MPRRNDRILQKYVSCHRNLISSSAKKEVYYDSYSTYRRQRRIIRGGALSVRFSCCLYPDRSRNILSCNIS
jgi:hypothetical protein